MIKTIKDISSKPSMPIDLMAELAAKKKKLTKVETKDLSSLNVQKADSSSSQTSNSMMAAIIAKRSAMKKVSGSQNPPPSQPKPHQKKQQPKYNPQKIQKKMKIMLQKNLQLHQINRLQQINHNHHYKK